MLTQAALHHMACLPDLWVCVPNWHSPTRHACLICGHAYPTGTPPCGKLAESVGTLTHPALMLKIVLAITLEHACSTCKPSLRILAPYICGHDMPPPFPGVQLSGMLASLSNACINATHLMPMEIYKPVLILNMDIIHCFLVVHSAFSLP